MLIYPIFIPQQGCLHSCIYCDQIQFDSVEQLPFNTIQKQLELFCSKHKNQPRQVAFYGGTFTGLTLSERETYYKLVEPFLDNQMTIRISTRPDYINTEILSWCKEHNIKTIELGIQDFNDEVLLASKRGYDAKQAMEACTSVKKAGFELGIQLMPGLPQSSQITRFESMNNLLNVSPDFIRLYPLIILANTPLWKEWEAGKYIPLSLEEAINVCAEYCDFATQAGIKVIKVGIPSLVKGSKSIGPYHPAFGELVKGELLIRKIRQGYNQEETINISCKDISMLTGHKGYNLIKLLERLKKCSVKIEQKSDLKTGEVSYVKK